MKIAITGASGHVGSNLCPELKKLNIELRALEHLTKVFESGGIEIIQGDIRSPETLHPLVKGMDLVIHLAAKISISGREKELLFQVNDKGTRNVVDACLAHGVKRLIHFSTIHAYNPHPLDQVLDVNSGSTISGRTVRGLSIPFVLSLSKDLAAGTAEI